MKKLTTLASALIIAVTAPLANAYSVIDSEVISGTVNSVDLDNNVLIIDKKFGGTASIALPESTYYRLNGESVDLANFSEGVDVRIRRKTVTKAEAPISGEVVRVNKAKRIASIRTHEGKLVKVQLGEAIRISGLVESTSIEDLERGYQVTIAAK